MDELADSLARYGIQPWLTFTRTLVALVGPDSSLLSCNSAFDNIRSNLPATENLTEIFISFEQVLQAAQENEKPRQICVELVARQSGAKFNCLLIPLPDKNLLFFAEAIQQSQAEFNELAEELQKNKRALDLKKIELQAVLDQVDEIAHTDPLTYISNRRQIVGNLQRETAHCDRYHDPLTIFMVDIDHFKNINDSYGHQAGDEVLRLLANELREGIRLSDYVGRYGGEEFLVLLPGTGLPAAIDLANRLLELAQTLEVRFNGNVLKVTISIGIAQYCPGQENWEGVLQRADQALYHSKNNGRNCWSTKNFSD